MNQEQKLFLARQETESDHNINMLLWFIQEYNFVPSEALFEYFKSFCETMGFDKKILPNLDN